VNLFSLPAVATSGQDCKDSRHQLDRAKKKIGAVAFKETGTVDGQWLWCLPEDAPKDEKTCP
jgi:hypothetical protein